MRLSAFSINTIFVVMMILGISLIPRLSLQLEPSSRSNKLNISFSWTNANPELLETEVTTKLEGAFARIRGLNEIHSTTGNGYGAIELTIDPKENIDAVKLYLSSIIRSVTPGLPEGVRISGVSGGEIHDGRVQETERHLLMTYVLTGPGNSKEVGNFAEDRIVPVISTMPGVESMNVTGIVPFEWIMQYDRELFADIGLSANDISNAISEYYFRKDGGKILTETVPEKKYSYLVFQGNSDDDKTNIMNLPIKVINGKIIYLHNIVALDYQESDPGSYYRINGLNQINLNVYAAKNANMIELAGRVKTEMAQLTESFPENYSVKLIRDNSTEIKDELSQILNRTGVTILILLLFVYLVSRDFRYLGIITTCLLANLSIALVFYYFFKIELHLYTLAGITVSFGIIIDSVIVMTDHYRHFHNRKAFLAVLAATLTTVGALTVIFNMDNNIMKNMWDFSAVIIINLGVSLAVALFFVPALMEKIPLKPQNSKRKLHRQKRIIRFNRRYLHFARFTKKYRRIVIIVTILGFGLPVFLLPSSVDRDKWYSSAYNTVFGSETYLTIKPYIDKTLGGSLRLFMEGGGDTWLQSRKTTESQKTRLTLTMSMPHGATIKQMNEAFEKLENFLSGFETIATFTSDVSSANRGEMVIMFKEEHEKDGSPEQVKNELIRFANTIGNGDSEVNGVGRGFSNRTSDEFRSESIKVIGYNYRKVLQYADILKQRLEKNIRVKKLHIGSDRSPKTKAFAVEVDKEKLARNNSNINNLLGNLHSLTYSGTSSTRAYINDEYTTIDIRPEKKVEASVWDVRNRPLRGDKSVFRLEDVGDITEEKNFENITKRNQEYEVEVQYDFIGAYRLSEKVKEREMKAINQMMPVGFRVKEGNDWKNYWQREIGGIDARILYILLVIGIIYFICAILLESLRQAAIVICITPISFIGCFLGGYFFGVGFDEGCLAAFILLSGLSVNAVLYILNDYNIKVREGAPRGIRTYIKAYNAKIIPIFLTIASTLLGFIPFLIGDINPFWKSLAIGTMSGLTFSLPVLIIYLPMTFSNKDTTSPNPSLHRRGNRRKEAQQYSNVASPPPV